MNNKSFIGQLAIAFAVLVLAAAVFYLGWTIAHKNFCCACEQSASETAELPGPTAATPTDQEPSKLTPTATHADPAPTQTEDPGDSSTPVAPTATADPTQVSTVPAPTETEPVPTTVSPTEPCGANPGNDKCVGNSGENPNGNADQYGWPENGDQGASNGNGQDSNPNKPEDKGGDNGNNSKGNGNKN